MSNKAESWRRLENAEWCNTESIARMNDKSTRFQRLRDGSGPIIRDEYKVTIKTFPRKLTPEQYLIKIAMDFNAAINVSRQLLCPV